MSREFHNFKDPDSVLPFGFDWTNWLVTGDTVSTCVIAVTSPSGDSAPITAGTPTVSGAVTSALLSAGTVGNAYTVRFRITTSNGYTDDRSIFIQVKER